MFISQQEFLLINHKDRLAKFKSITGAHCKKVTIFSLLGQLFACDLIIKLHCLPTNMRSGDLYDFDNRLAIVGASQTKFTAVLSSLWRVIFSRLKVNRL